jgi:hypothetical protein
MLLLPLLLGNAKGSVNGVEGASLIFLFVMGLNLFKPSFLFMQANGVTRRHFYMGSLMTIAAVSVCLTIVDALLFGANAQSLSGLLYAQSGFVARLIWTLAGNLAATAAGWFVTMLFYRSGKALKLVLAIAPPVLLCVGLPLLDSVISVTPALGRFAALLLGLSGRPDAWIGALSLIVLAALLSSFCFLLVRRAPVKN